MAYLASRAIVKRVRELVHWEKGSFYPIEEGRFEGLYYETLSDDAAGKRATVAPRLEVRFRLMTKRSNSTTEFCSTKLYDFEIECAVIRHMHLEHKVDDCLRDEIRALAWEDGDVLRQSLSTPGNMRATEDGALTGVVSGCLKYDRSELTRFQLGDNAPGLIETTHRFTGVAKVDANA